MATKMNETASKFSWPASFGGRMQLPFMPGAGAATGLPMHMPFNLFDTLIPGYSMFAGYISQLFGFDVTVLFSLCFVLFGLTKSVDFLWAQVWRWVEGFGTSEILVESDSDIYAWVTQWLMKRGTAASARSLVARKSYMNGPNGAPMPPPPRRVGRRGPGIYASGDQGQDAASAQAVWYEPSVGSYYFWYRRRLFRLALGMSRSNNNLYLGGVPPMQTKQARISCFGRSPAPIKALISEAAAQHSKDLASNTIIKRPHGEGYGPQQYWNVVATRPSRPLDTVILDDVNKDRLIADIADYLLPETAQWYSDRGIPYRRGYLLHGPPGTGKTSLSFAIAGIFNLEIHCISLQEPSLTEQGLTTLFDTLPRNCVVLLEDIDHAGVRNASKEPAAPEPDSAAPFPSPRALRPMGPMPLPPPPVGSSISLSGLLNVIDGISSQEGRVLIMTTNYIDKLDDALIRPGRIDMQVQFTLATKTQIQELFVRMFQPTKKKEPSSEDEAVEEDKPLVGIDPEAEKIRLAEAERHREKFEPARVRELAVRFSDICPAGAFSPAEIQGFLLMNKHDPEAAVLGAEKWKDEALEKKRAGSDKGSDS